MAGEELVVAAKMPVWLKMKDLYRTLFTGKSDHWFIQLFRYGFVGGFSAVVDVGSLYIFTDILHIHYLISAILGFLLGTIVNYALSVLWVFKASGKIKAELVIFTLIGFGGLLLNELIIWLLVSKADVFYMLAKVVSLSIVLFWSFSLRRILFVRLNAKNN